MINLEVIKEVEVIFENVEGITIPATGFVQLEIENIERMARPQRNSNVIDLFVCANHIVFCLAKSANIAYNPFGVAEMGLVPIFDRIKRYKDIVAFALKFTDGSVLNYVVAWSRESEDINKWQTYYEDNDGNLYVVIDAHMTAERYSKERVKDVGGEVRGEV